MENLATLLRSFAGPYSCIDLPLHESDSAIFSASKTERKRKKLLSETAIYMYIYVIYY